MAEKLAAAAGAAPRRPPVPPAGRRQARRRQAGRRRQRELPPLDKITDPKDLAEALRRPVPRKTRRSQPQGRRPPPSPRKPKGTQAADASCPGPRRASAGFGVTATRRAFTSMTGLARRSAGSAFTVGCLQFTLMLVRFMFPNVLAEPPSTIKIGLADRLRAGGRSTSGSRPSGASGSSARPGTTARTSSTPSSRSAPTSAVRRTGWPASRNSSARATAAVSTSRGSTSKAPPLGRWNGSRSRLADDGQIMVDKSQKFQEELGQWADPDSFVNA